MKVYKNESLSILFSITLFRQSSGCGDMPRFRQVLTLMSIINDNLNKRRSRILRVRLRPKQNITDYQPPGLRRQSAQQHLQGKSGRIPAARLAARPGSRSAGGERQYALHRACGRVPGRACREEPRTAQRTVAGRHRPHLPAHSRGVRPAARAALRGGSAQEFLAERGKGFRARVSRRCGALLRAAIRRRRASRKPAHGACLRPQV